MPEGKLDKLIMLLYTFIVLLFSDIVTLLYYFSCVSYKLSLNKESFLFIFRPLNYPERLKRRVFLYVKRKKFNRTNEF